jgi:calcium-dependent protein kinase
VVHRDISSATVLLVDKGSDAYEVQLTDFGLSSYMDDAQALPDSTNNVIFSAPEVGTGVYNMKCDVWSAGVLMYMLISGREPFSSAAER